MKPMLSIIIPTLNEQRYIGRLLDSIAAQQVTVPFEVIVVDGQSADKTRSVARTHQSRGESPRVYACKRGISRQRNFGAARARGEYFLFLDADVVLPRHFLATLLKKLPEARAFVGTCFSLLNDMNLEIWLWSFLSLPLGTFFCWRHRMTLGQCTIVSRLTHRRIGGYDETIAYAEDTEYGRRAIASGAVYRYFWNPPVYFSARRLVQTGVVPWLMTKFRESAIQRGIADNQNPNAEYGIFGDDPVSR